MLCMVVLPVLGIPGICKLSAVRASFNIGSDTVVTVPVNAYQVDSDRHFTEGSFALQKKAWPN